MLGKKSQDLETIIGNGTQLTGEINANGTIRVDGTVEGNIGADWVIIGEAGIIRGNAKTRGIVVGGSIEGNIDADESVELSGKSRMIGEICTKKLLIAEGAFFDGQSRMKVESSRESSNGISVISRLLP